MIREDYRGRITREFLSIKEVEVYEQTFPIHTATGVVWVHSRMGYRELAPDGHLKAFGILQRVTEPVNKEDKDRMYHINNLLYRQNSISHSLSHFLKDESVASGIYEILKDILDFFHAGRAYIFEYEKDYTFQTCTYEVVAEGVLPAVEAFRNITGLLSCRGGLLKFCRRNLYCSSHCISCPKWKKANSGYWSSRVSKL